MSTEETVLSNEEKDILKEVINIAFGLSSSLIGDMLDSYVVLALPQIDIVDVQQMEKIIADNLSAKSSYFIAKQLFKSDFSGETIFVMRSEEAEKLTKMTLKKDNVTANNVENTFSELSNIITTACIGQIGEMIHESIYFEPPVVDIKRKEHIIETEYLLKFDRVIIMESLLNLEDAGIHGHMFILTDMGSYANLKKFLIGI